VPPSDNSWSIRALLGPVAARLLIFGVNPFDLERVLQRIERTPIRNARQLESLWLEEWEELARSWRERRLAATMRSGRRSALGFGMQEAGCRLAQFLINTAEVSRKRASYLAFAESYRRAVEHYPSPVLSVEIPLAERGSLAASLHLPSGSSRHPCVAVFSGLGSCKEEMHTLARLMVERGVAALVPDMPGSGESLFLSHLTCGASNLSSAFRAVADFVEQRSELDASRLGVSGLCMGGGYAFRACAEETRYRWCALFFPLFVDRVGDDVTPEWMKGGEWFALQAGGKSGPELLADVGWRETDTVTCPLFLAHGRHDNWMTLERAEMLYARATSSQKQLLVVEDEPAYSSGQAVTHTMPVGEQLSWVGPVVADWIAERAGVTRRGPDAV
jgi:dienelactone hydrolase